VEYRCRLAKRLIVSQNVCQIPGSARRHNNSRSPNALYFIQTEVIHPHHLLIYRYITVFLGESPDGVGCSSAHQHEGGPSRNKMVKGEKWLSTRSQLSTFISFFQLPIPFELGKPAGGIRYGSLTRPFNYPPLRGTARVGELQSGCDLASLQN